MDRSHQILLGVTFVNHAVHPQGPSEIDQVEGESLSDSPAAMYGTMGLMIIRSLSSLVTVYDPTGLGALKALPRPLRGGLIRPQAGASWCNHVSQSRGNPHTQAHDTHSGV